MHEIEGNFDRRRRKMKTYDKFNDINGGVGGAKSGDSQVEATSEELFGLFLTLLWEVRIDTSAAVHRYSPTAHAPLSLSLRLFCYPLNCTRLLWDLFLFLLFLLCFRFQLCVYVQGENGGGFDPWIYRRISKLLLIRFIFYFYLFFFLILILLYYYIL